MDRKDKNNYYLDIAQSVAQRGTCLRRNYGAIIVKNDEIISTGYCGSPRGTENCCDAGYCERQKANIPSGERYELCRSVHAEMNAVISAPRRDMFGAHMYLVGVSVDTGELFEDTDACKMCKRVLINSGISSLVIRRTSEDYELYSVSDWVLFGKI